MKVYNKEKTKILEQYDLTKGYLKLDTIDIAETEAVEEKSHLELIAEYSNGGKSYKKVVDTEAKPFIPAHQEEIYVYIPYTQKELAQSHILELKQKLANTDYEALKYAEGVMTEAEYAPYKADRQKWRAEINELEKKL